MGNVCTLGDLAMTTAPHAHNCGACPHVCQGPAISASANVRVGGKPALRQGDTGIHMSCCGMNTWIAIQGSGQVFINGAAAVRIGDKTSHCSISDGKMQTASATVSDGSAFGPIAAPFNVQVGGAPGAVTVRDEDALSMLPCDHPMYVPPGGRPERPSASSPDTTPEQRREQKVNDLQRAGRMGYDVDDQLAEEEREALAALNHADSVVNDAVEAGGETLRRARENRTRAAEHFETIRAARGGAGGARVRRGGGNR